METLAPSLAHPDLPQRLGPYEILGVLGRGGMGIVYSGYDSSLDRRVAVKVLAPILAGDAVYRERFLREARAMASVTHKNVAQVHFAGEDAGGPFFAMEFIQGESAQDLLARGPMPVDEALDIVLQAASGLAAANQQGIIHRDVKPSNLMVAEDGTVKVLDFGLARAPSHSHLTAADLVMGSPDYMSPEQGRGQHPDHRSDIYALGATLYHLLTGAPPFPGETPLAIIQSHINDLARPLDQLRADVPPPVCRVIEKMMHKNPDRRQQGYGQLMMDVASLRQSPEMLAITAWNESSPHNRFWAFCWKLVTRPGETFTRGIVERSDSEIDGFLVRTAAVGTLLHTLFVPVDRWGPHQVVLYGIFAFGLPSISRVVDRLACRALKLRATPLELTAIEHYASVCLLPCFLMPRPWWPVQLLALISAVAYLRVRTVGLAFVTGLPRGRALALALGTGLVAALCAGVGLAKATQAFTYFGYDIRVRRAFGAGPTP